MQQWRQFDNKQPKLLILILHYTLYLCFYGVKLNTLDLWGTIMCVCDLPFIYNYAILMAAIIIVYA